MPLFQAGLTWSRTPSQSGGYTVQTMAMNLASESRRRVRNDQRATNARLPNVRGTSLSDEAAWSVLTAEVEIREAGLKTGLNKADPAIVLEVQHEESLGTEPALAEPVKIPGLRMSTTCPSK